MNCKPQPPLPADDDEARFDDEGSAIGHPEPAESVPPKQKAGTEIPGHNARPVYDNLGKAGESDSRRDVSRDPAPCDDRNSEA